MPLREQGRGNDEGSCFSRDKLEQPLPLRP